jgi:hypothetical protein
MKKWRRTLPAAGTTPRNDGNVTGKSLILGGVSVRYVTFSIIENDPLS